MYGTLALTPRAVNDYRDVVGQEALDELRRLAEPLQGLRVLHLSVTAFGTGVAELLNAAVPLLCDVGLDCHWQVVRGAEESAATNRALYRALGGSSSEWTPEMGETWLRYSEMNAELLTEPFDVIIVHDPQPAAIRSFVSEETRAGSRWILHSHLDLSSADPRVWALLHRHIDPYDAIVFDAAPFVHPDLRLREVAIIRPAIDPLGPRNMPLDHETITTILQRYGLDPHRRLMCQTAPSDPGSDLICAIDMQEELRQEFPGIQLAIIVSNPPEGPEGIAYFDEVARRSMDCDDVHILRGVSEIGNVEVNAFQSAATVVVQTGLRKGFGIWIADALWKERPVVSCRTAGLMQQVIDGETGFLADGCDEFSEKIALLLRDPELAGRLGRAGREHVAKNFLLPRFLADELRLLAGVAKVG